MPAPHPEPPNRWTVQVSRDLEEIVPIFLANRHRDVLTLRSALATEDFAMIQMLGHRMKGDGGGYGFDQITQIGAEMEQAGKQQDRAAATQSIVELEDFLQRVDVVYQ